MKISCALPSPVVQENTQKTSPRSRNSCMCGEGSCGGGDCFISTAAGRQAVAHPGNPRCQSSDLFLVGYGEGRLLGCAHLVGSGLRVRCFADHREMGVAFGFVIKIQVKVQKHFGWQERRSKRVLGQKLGLRAMLLSSFPRVIVRYRYNRQAQAL
ncbi:hypothetical protein N431DRAFT_435076 [Stipitochalara longipes BDJ]|nr:hypothetical protein N431DRAFT_435076 [Stipitochalara longipes BDJ]